MSLMVKLFWGNALLSLQRMIAGQQISDGVMANSQERVLRYREHLEHAAVRSKYRSSSFRRPDHLASVDIVMMTPRYRALSFTSDGRIACTQRLSSRNDTEALHAAKMIVDNHAVDLWDGLRFIEHFEPKSVSIPLGY